MSISVIARLAFTAALVVTVTSTSLRASDLTGGVLTDQAAHVCYDPSTGDVAFYSPGDPLTSMQIESRSGLFRDWTWDTSTNFFNVATAEKQAVFNFDGFAGSEPFPLGPVLPPGMSLDEIIADLAADGSRLAGGKIDTSPGGGPYVGCLPEPSSAALAYLGVVFCLFLRRR